MFKIIENNKDDELLQFSQTLAADEDIIKLKEFYKEIQYNNDPRFRTIKLQCKLKIKQLEKNKKKDIVLW